MAGGMPPTKKNNPDGGQECRPTKKKQRMRQECPPYKKLAMRTTQNRISLLRLDARDLIYCYKSAEA